MLKTEHLQLPSNEWLNLHDLSVSLENARASCGSDFGEEVSQEIRTIIENTEKRIQRILNKNFTVRSKDFNKYHIVTYSEECGEDSKEYCRTLTEAKKRAIYYFNNGYENVEILRNHVLVWKIYESHKKVYKPNK